MLSCKVEAKGTYFTSGNLFYHTIGNGKVEVCGTAQDSGTLRIPSKVIYRGKSYKVTQIADQKIYYQDMAISRGTSDGFGFAVDMSGFHSYQYEKADKFPEQVGELSNANISKLILPSSITYIGEGKFWQADKLTFVIPKGLIDIDSYAFSGTATVGKMKVAINKEESLCRVEM